MFNYIYKIENINLNDLNELVIAIWTLNQAQQALICNYDMNGKLRQTDKRRINCVKITQNDTCRTALIG